MENIEQENSDLELESGSEHGLWLTDSLLLQLWKSAFIGIPLMIICGVLGLSYAGMSASFLVWFWSGATKADFYLLENGNLIRVFDLLSNIAVFYCFGRAIVHGYKAWRDLRLSPSDDEALLEGSQQLGSMFRWLSFWGAIYLGSALLRLGFMAL